MRKLLRLTPQNRLLCWNPRVARSLVRYLASSAMIQIPALISRRYLAWIYQIRSGKRMYETIINRLLVSHVSWPGFDLDRFNLTVDILVYSSSAALDTVNTEPGTHRTHFGSFCYRTDNCSVLSGKLWIVLISSCEGITLSLSSIIVNKGPIFIPNWRLTLSKLDFNTDHICSFGSP